jgi:hypothetical protein
MQARMLARWRASIAISNVCTHSHCGRNKEDVRIQTPSRSRWTPPQPRRRRRLARAMADLAQQFGENTLDEPVSETIMRDVRLVRFC